MGYHFLLSFYHGFICPVIDFFADNSVFAFEFELRFAISAIEICHRLIIRKMFKRGIAAAWAI